MNQIVIAACRPIDTSGLPPLPPGSPPIPPPMADDTIRVCERCGQDCWVAPRKLALAEAGKATIMCMMCAVATVGPRAAMVDLHPGRVERPRR